MVNSQEICDLVNQCHDPSEAAHIVTEQVGSCSRIKPGTVQLITGHFCMKEARRAWMLCGVNLAVCKLAVLMWYEVEAWCDKCIWGGDRKHSPEVGNASHVEQWSCLVIEFSGAAQMWYVSSGCAHGVMKSLPKDNWNPVFSFMFLCHTQIAFRKANDETLIIVLLILLLDPPSLWSK